METAEASQMVLVVEDEALIRMSTAAALEDAGFAVLEARDAAHAVDVLASYSDIDVVVTDVRMPGRMDGLGLASLLRREYPAIRVLIVSGNTSSEDAYRTGAAGFLRKPFPADSVVRAVRRLAPQDPPPRNRRAA